MYTVVEWPNETLHYDVLIIVSDVLIPGKLSGLYTSLESFYNYPR